MWSFPSKGRSGEDIVGEGENENDEFDNVGEGDDKLDSVGQEKEEAKEQTSP